MIKAYSVVIFSMCGGLRALEVQHALAENVTIGCSGVSIYVDHVKGQDSYGYARHIPMIPEARDLIAEFMDSRQTYLEEVGVHRDCLIPSIQSNNPLSYNSLNKLKSRVSDDLGIKFDLRKCRRTYGRYLVDSGVTLDIVQVAMGHNGPNTTFRNYAGIRTEMVPSLVFDKLSGGQSKNARV